MDEEGFKEAMEVQRQKARDAREETNYMGADVTIFCQSRLMRPLRVNLSDIMTLPTIPK